VGQDSAEGIVYEAFFCWALRAFLRLLRIMTTDRKEPTTVEKRTMRMTGMRMAQTRGRKSECSRWSSSTKGWAGQYGRGGRGRRGLP
jgi:hypothetical protein